MGQLDPLVSCPLHSIQSADRTTALHSPKRGAIRDAQKGILARFRIKGAVAVPGRYSLPSIEGTLRAFSTDLTAERNANNSKLDRCHGTNQGSLNTDGSMACETVKDLRDTKRVKSDCRGGRICTRRGRSERDKDQARNDPEERRLHLSCDHLVA